MKSRFLVLFGVFSIFFLFVSSLIVSYSGFCNDMDVPGGVRDVPANQISGEIESLARFAVDEHNKNENALVEFARVVKAKTQVVAGAMYYLTLEVTDQSGNKKIYEAKVWEKPWLQFKELQWFKPVSDSYWG